MLTPEYLNMIEFNDVVDIYNKLNIDITSDIIRRVSKMKDISSTSKKQLKVLLETNGTEIFNQVLNDASLLTKDVKEALKEIYTDMAQNDMQGYKELYLYRDKPLKLSAVQYQILNAGLKKTSRTLKNFTNTIAFRSKQTYIEAVDKAYTKVISGAFDYKSAINTAVQELAEKGVTLKDKAGRNIQLEVAVRRNVLGGIQETANLMNRDIEKDLGCDGYEVTAHIGARPTHAQAQGQQYALNHKTSISKKYPLWKKVEHLWKEANCRHTYFGIILGISKPQYTDKELKEFKEATVTLNGKEVPYYEATQKQRQIENKIRNTKRSIDILNRSEQDSIIQNAKLKEYQKEYNAFCKETKLPKNYFRTKMSPNKSTNYVKSSIIELPNYKDATIPEEKFTKYLLNKEHPKGKDKAIAFERALGYTQDNYHKLINNIKDNVNKYNAVEKGNNGYGKQYEVLMSLVGENNKVANVKTAWIIDDETKETKFVTAYVTSKKWKEGN